MANTGSLRSLDPRVENHARTFIRLLERAGVDVRVTSTRRDLATQKRLYDDFRAGRSRYPAAPPGRSIHGLGFAFDMILDGQSPGRRSTPLYTAVGRLWERLGFTWGGRFGDPIHFDYRPSRRA